RGSDEPVRMPHGLAKNKPAAALWKRIAPTLIDTGRLTAEQAEPFALMCRLHAEIERLDGRIATDGDTIVNTKGDIVKHPAHTMLRAARTEYVALARDFGLTAAAVARLPIEDDDADEDDPLAEFMT
ncbi:MAG: phage terminase small subunit P27 family, partial [Planctomycetia bacterium]